MAYYPKDAAVMEHLRAQIQSLGMPLVLMRKFNPLMGAISVQVEDEFTSRRVIDMVFIALTGYSGNLVARLKKNGDRLLE